MMMMMMMMMMVVFGWCLVGVWLVGMVFIGGDLDPKEMDADSGMIIPPPEIKSNNYIYM